MTQNDKLAEHIAAAKKALVENPNDARNHYNWACILIGQGEYEEAEQELKRAVHLNKELAEAYVQLGGLAMRKGDLNLSLSYNQAAIKIRPRFAVPHGNVGFVHLQKHEVDKAIKAFRKAISLDPKFVQAIASLGSAYLMNGDPDGCIEQSRKAVELQPSFGPAYHNMCLAYLEKEMFSEAVASCDLAMQYGFETPQEVLEELKPHRAEG